MEGQDEVDVRNTIADIIARKLELEGVLGCAADAERYMEILFLLEASGDEAADGLGVAGGDAVPERVVG